jgi:hypothetical protein
MFMMIQEVASQRNCKLFTITEALNTIDARFRPTFLHPFHDDNIYTESLDTDALNTRLSLAALCLLRQNPNEYATVFHSLDLQNPSLLLALSSRAPCRWEKYLVTTRLYPALLTEGNNIENKKEGKAENVIENTIKSCVRKPNQESKVFVINNIDNNNSSASVKDNHDDEGDTTNSNMPPKEIEIEVVMDVGHNPAAVSALTDRLLREYPMVKTNNNEKLWNIR